MDTDILANNPKYLDPSYKMDPDFLEFLEVKHPFSTTIQNTSIHLARWI